MRHQYKSLVKRLGISIDTNMKLMKIDEDINILLINRENRHGYWIQYD